MVCVCACLHAPKPSVFWLRETPTVTYNVDLPVHNTELITKKINQKKKNTVICFGKCKELKTRNNIRNIQVQHFAKKTQ